MYRSKYHATKVKTEYGTFDSKKEYKRFLELKALEDSGEISDLQRQVPYELIPKQRRSDGKAERSVIYKADFVYTYKGETIVEDSKGMRTPEYILKRKLLLFRHGISIKES